MARLPPRANRTDQPFPHTPPCRSQAADHAGFLLRRRIEAAGDGERVIAAHHGAEVARGGELVVQPAVGNKEHLPVAFLPVDDPRQVDRSEEHTSELQSLMRISYAVFCLKKKKKDT